MITPAKNLVVARIEYKKRVLEAIEKTKEQISSHDGLVKGLIDINNSVKNRTSVGNIKLARKKITREDIILARGNFAVRRAIEDERQNSFNKGKKPTAFNKQYVIRMLEAGHNNHVELPQIRM